MIDYWYYTGDTSYNDVVAQALLSQVSPTNDFMMPAQHFDLVCVSHMQHSLLPVNHISKGNDDQVFWALSAMAAAEYNFPNPSALSWIELAKNVFDDLNSRWNVTTCNGGLKWQIYSTNVGYGYKSTITNTGFFQLSARLARYTGNTTYLETNEKVWNWMTGVGLISNGYNVYDGTDDTINCSSVNHDQWTYNNAALIYGTAMLANVSADTTPWLNRTIGFLNAAKSLFFSPYFNATNVMFEAECEQPNTCDVDQFSFKAYLSRWLYGSAKLLPQLENTIIDIMVPTALAAAQSCSGGSNDRSCGTRWWYGGWDGAMGLGQQMAALEAIHGLLINTVDAPSIAPIKSSAII